MSLRRHRSLGALEEEIESRSGLIVRELSGRWLAVFATVRPVRALYFLRVRKLFWRWSVVELRFGLF